MPKRSVSLYGIVLRIEPRGERFRALSLISSEEGSLLGLQRVSSRKPPKRAIDLFDEGEFVLELDRHAHSGFIADFELTRRREKLARSYAALSQASEFARILSRNAAHAENQVNLFSLLQTGLAAWETGLNPKATLFKCLYLFCRDEGYPIKEDWIARTPADARARYAQLLNQPLAEIDLPADQQSAALEDLTRYLRESTHIHI